MIQRVFIDANVYISDGKPPGGDIIRAVRNLVNAGKVEVITTDITINEITKHFTNHDIKNLGGAFRPHVRKLIETISGVAVPEYDPAVIKEKFWQTNEENTRAMMSGLRAAELSADKVSARGVLTAYSQEIGFFDNGAKKDQISDAFIFETLRQLASEENPIVIYSKDGDFEKAATASQYISIVKEAGDLLALLDLRLTGKNLQRFFFPSQQEIIERLFQKELEDYEYICSDDFDWDVEFMHVERVEFEEIEDFEINEREILVTGDAYVTVMLHVSGDDMSNAIRDSDDGSYYAFDKIDADFRTTIEVPFNMTILVDQNGVPEKIPSVTVDNCKDFWFSLEESV